MLRFDEGVFCDAVLVLELHALLGVCDPLFVDLGALPIRIRRTKCSLPTTTKQTLFLLQDRDHFRDGLAVGQNPGVVTQLVRGELERYRDRRLRRTEEPV